MKSKLWFKLLLLIFFLAGNLTANSRLVLLDISTAPLPWNDSRLYQKFEKMLTRDENIRVQRTDNLPPSQLPFPHDRNNLDSLINWGLEMGGRYLLVVTGHSERLERHKSFNLPLIFHKYETVGIIDGDCRLLDLQRQKTLVAES
ncbi:MAG: hypothetical protein PHU88_05040, partial [candidate division Zixibacteria bacterium]|nr:hypothetical protein [candidate division Zixibacteria bacterium]